jgi:ferredoxin, 2Fe-2S
MDVEIKFEPDGRSGIVATGTYLFDAARRLGINLEAECERQGACDSCKVTILSGKNLLSEPTKAELERLDAEQIIKGERLSCQTKIISAGEINVMAEKKKEPEKTEEEKAKEAEAKRVEDFRKEFAEMPLEKKIATLVDLEAAALSETFSYVVNSPYKIVDKIFDVLAEFGLKMDRADKERQRPAEHKEEEKAEENGAGGKKKKSSKKAADEKTEEKSAAEKTADEGGAADKKDE